MKKFVLTYITLFFVFILSFSSMAATTQVAIELETYSDDKTNYLPNEIAEYVVTLKNLLGPSWVRVNFSVETKGLEKDATVNNIKISKDWVKKGNYFYYTKKAESFTDYTVADGFQIPDMDKVAEGGGKIIISVYAEAIEYGAFSPDFNKDDPWEDAEIKHTASSSGGVGNYSGYTGGYYHIHEDLKPNGTSDSAVIYKNPSSSGIYTKGQWILVDIPNKDWHYQDATGNLVKNGWICVQNPWSHTDKEGYNWYHFDENGQLSYGWLKDDNGVWYYTNEISDGDLGKLKYGWHLDPQDGKTYYLDPTSGIMLSGWQQIDGNWYCFATVNDIPSQTWFWNTSLGKWIYELFGFRSYGSMYVNEKTPDGHFVNNNGVRME